MRGCKGQHQGVCREVMSPRNVRSYTQKVSPTWLSKPELNKDSNRPAKASRGEPTGPRPYAEDSRQRRRGEGEKWSWPGKNTLVSYPIANDHPENTHTSNSFYLGM